MDIQIFYSLDDNDSRYSIVTSLFSSKDEFLSDTQEHEYLAEKCAEDFFDHHDGWEIFGEQNSKAKIYLYLTNNDEEESFGEFDIECTYYPSFYATRIKEQGK